MVSDFKHFWLRVLKESLLYTEHDVVLPSVGYVVHVMPLPLWHIVRCTILALPMVAYVHMHACQPLHGCMCTRM